MRSPGKRYRHLKRYQEIARVLIRHGFDGLMDQLGLIPVLSLPRRLLHREPEAPPLVAEGGRGFIFWLVVGFAAASFMGLGLLYSIWWAGPCGGKSKEKLK
jgi:hypothetical protein